ncbi:MAG: bifunctional diguanylate cyclase/phosphodiesterase, partial [Pseudomonadota bacterium]
WSIVHSMRSQYELEIKSELDIILRDKKLSTLFQPIVNITKQKIYGYEGLIRGPSNSILHSPTKLFEAAYQFGRLAELDFLCRYQLINQFKQLSLPGKLFLNTNPESLLEKDYIDGETIKYVQQAGLSPKDIVIEITESYPIEDFSLLTKSINHYRNAGFSVAIDDLGTGYSGLKLWSQMRPDFVKIDRHFISSINDDRIKRQFVISIYEIANSIGCQVIAEGVETAEEYATIRKLGAEYVQGFYFCHPESLPPKKTSKFLFRSKDRFEQTEVNHTAGELLLPMPMVCSSTTLAETVDLFLNNPSALSVAIVDNDEPQGLMTRVKAMDILASRFGRALFSRKSIYLFMNRNILVVDTSMPLEILSQRITSSIDTYIDEFIIVKKGHFIGKGILLDLLKEITDLRVEMARYANPLTQLPGNVPIQKKMTECLAADTDFTVAYCDLDHFKPYNDYYGYSQGDKVLKLLSQIFKSQLSHDAGFIGHIGGDDFILFYKSKKWYKSCHNILLKFSKKITEMYNSKDRKQGYISAKDRYEITKKYPIMSLSIGVIVIKQGHNLYSDEISDLASKAKSEAKKAVGNSISFTQLDGQKQITFKTITL